MNDTSTSKDVSTCATHAAEFRMRDTLPCPWCAIDELKRNRDSALQRVDALTLELENANANLVKAIRATGEPPAEQAEALAGRLNYEARFADSINADLRMKQAANLIQTQQATINRLEHEAGGSRERGTSPNRSCGTAGQSGPASSSSAQPPAPEWQPIESAPKDGRKFLAIGMGPMFICRWGSGANIWMDDAGQWRDPRLWQHLPEGPCLLPSAYSTSTKESAPEECPCDAPYREGYECMHPHIQAKYRCRRLAKEARPCGSCAGRASPDGILIHESGCSALGERSDA